MRRPIYLFERFLYEKGQKLTKDAGRRSNKVYPDYRILLIEERAFMKDIL